MIRRQHASPLQADVELDIRLDRLDSLSSEVPAREHSWLLGVEYKARSRWRLPGVTLRHDGNTLFSQYLEPGQSGRRWINLSGIEGFENLSLAPRHCRLEPRAQLLGFHRPALDQGPMLVVAPHPDDAELAAFGLYQRLAEHSWIVTLTAGERMKRLDRQYIPGLDDDIAMASRRKGMIRAWNSATTPLLAGLPQERLIMLGYFNDTLGDMLAHPDSVIAPREGTALSPADFRRWNRQRLPSDESPANRGDALVQDLKALIEEIRPLSLVVTHPEVDPHPDHIAAAKACARALELASHRPEHILLYANHLRGQRGFPYGPAHAAAGPWPLEQYESGFGPWRFYSERLSQEAQRDKAVALDSMHDLRASPSLEKRLKRAIQRRLSGLGATAYADYGQHDYFQTHIKAHECFALISPEAFLRLET